MWSIANLNVVYCAYALFQIYIWNAPTVKGLYKKLTEGNKSLKEAFITLLLTINILIKLSWLVISKGVKIWGLYIIEIILTDMTGVKIWWLFKGEKNITGNT